MILQVIKYFTFIFLLQISIQSVSQSTFGYGYNISESPDSYESSPKALIKYNDTSYVGVINEYFSETHILFMINENGKLLWIKKLDLNYHNIFRDIKVLSNGNIAVLYSGNSLFMKSILIKLNNNGNKIWAKKLFDSFLLIAPAQTGGMILTGAGSIKIYSLDSAGNSKSYQRLNYHYHHIQAVATDSNYKSTFISVNMQSQIGTGLLIGSFDSSGVISNKHFYSFSNYVMASSNVRLIQKKGDGHYALLCGPFPNPTLLLINFNKNKEVIWAKRILLPNFVLNSFPTPDITLTSSNGCLISTEFQMPALNYTLYSPLLIQIDSNGILISSKTVEDTASMSWINHKIYTIVPANSPDHFMAAGIGMRIYPQPVWQQIYSDLFIYRFNLNMDGFCDTTSINVNITPSVPYYDTIYSNLYLHSSKPNHFFKSNFYFSYHDISAYTYEVCTYNLLDSINTGVQKNNKPNNIKIFPNPAVNNIYVESKKIQNFDYKIYNTLGQCVLEGYNSRKSISIESLKSGYYMLIIESKNQSYHRKFSVIK